MTTFAITTLLATLFVIISVLGLSIGLIITKQSKMNNIGCHRKTKCNKCSCGKK